MIIRQRAFRSLKKIYSIVVIGVILYGMIPFGLNLPDRVIAEDTVPPMEDAAAMEEAVDPVVLEEEVVVEEEEEEEEEGSGDEGVPVEELTQGQVGSSGDSQTVATVPIITTDKADYAPGETVVISGVGSYACDVASRS